MKARNLEEIKVELEALAGAVAELDEESTSALKAVRNLVDDLVTSGETPVGIAELLSGCTAILDAMEGGAFAENYMKLCDTIDAVTMKAREALTVLASAAVDAPVEPVAAAEVVPEPVAVEPVAPPEAVEMVEADIDELDLQLDILADVAAVLSADNPHVLGVVRDLLDKIGNIATLPAGAGAVARGAANSAGGALDGTCAFDAALTEINAAVGTLQGALNKAKGGGGEAAAGVASAARPGDGLSSEACDQVAEMLENFEGDLLSLETDGANTMPEIMLTLDAIREKTTSMGADCMEGFLRDVEAALGRVSGAPGKEVVSALLGAKDLLQEYFGAVSAGEDAEPDEVSMKRILDIIVTACEGGKEREARPARPAAKPKPKAAAAMIEVKIPDVKIDTSNPELTDFVVESKEYLYNAEVALIELEKDPGSRGHLNEVFRSFHNIKGIAGFLALGDVQELAHNAESLMDKARDGRIEFSGPVSMAAFAALDLLKEMVKRVKAALEGASYSTPEAYCDVVRQLSDPAAFAPDTAAPAAAAVEAGEGDEDAPAEEMTASERMAEAGRQTVQGPAVKSEALVKVSTTRLDSLIDAVGELVIANAMVTQEPEVANTKNTRLARNVSLLGKITRELQELAMSMRMVSLKTTFNKMSRVARDLSVKSGTPVEFVVSGEDTEIDRNVVEEINSPLVHMVRNAIDHGLESPDERLRIGKQVKGRVELAAYHEGGNVVIKVSDDGKGLDAEAILAKAKKMGLVAQDAEMAEKDIFALIFHAGFSTAAKVTDVSGRGVGMDVVRSSIEALRGRVDIDSVRGRGTTFTIRMPLTMAIIDGMVIAVSEERYILPTIAIQESFRPRKEQLSTVAGRGEMVSLRGKPIPLFRLHRIFGVDGAKMEPEDALMLIMGENGSQYALMVDDLIGQQQVVIKSLGKAFDKIEGVSGGAIMGDGRVSLILDPSRIVRTAEAMG